MLNGFEKMVTHHVIIDERSINNLKVISHEELEINKETIVSIFCGTERECNNFDSHYTEHNFYPMIEMEELY